MTVDYRPQVPAVPEGVHRPLWSVLIPTHNCADFLKLTLESVLQQDPGKEAMQIVVVDDCSTKDDPESVVNRIAPERVEFIRQPTNVGKSKNFQTGLAASRGQLIHQLHGDDVVENGFYSSMTDCFDQFPSVSAFYCESQYIDSDGQSFGATGQLQEQSGPIDGFLQKIYVQQLIQTPSMVLRRQVYEELGGFDQRLSAFEDWEMWVRTATRFSIGFNTTAKAGYRVYTENTSSQSMLTGRREKIRKNAWHIIDSYTPEDIQRALRQQRSYAHAEHLCRCLPIALKHSRFFVWLRLLTGVLWHGRNIRLCLRAIKVSLQSGCHSTA